MSTAEPGREENMPEGTAGPLLQVDCVTKNFRGLRALSNVSFDLMENRILGLIGPNGAGKTTLFDVINGVYAPDAGQVLFKGEKISGRRTYHSARLGLARTHQVVRPLSELSVRENAIVGACFGRKNLRLKEAGPVADEVLEAVGLAPLAAKPAGALNVAQKKRLEMARALASQPYLLLLDEVLAGLNPTEMDAMLHTVRAIRDHGITIIMIEHVMRAIMSVSDHVVVLDHGEMIAQGSPREVAENTKVVEAYLGRPEDAERLQEEV